MKLSCIGFKIVFFFFSFFFNGSTTIFERWKNYLGGTRGMVRSLPLFFSLLMESIPLFWNAIKRSKSPQNVMILAYSNSMAKKLYRTVTLRETPRWEGKVDPDNIFRSLKLKSIWWLMHHRIFKRVSFRRRGRWG